MSRLVPAALVLCGAGFYRDDLSGSRPAWKQGGAAAIFLTLPLELSINESAKLA